MYRDRLNSNNAGPAFKLPKLATESSIAATFDTIVSTKMSNYGSFMVLELSDGYSQTYFIEFFLAQTQSP